MKFSLASGAFLLALVVAASAEDGDAFFASRIAPVLEQHCLKCHSHESGKMKGGLTLDSRSGWAEGGEQGPAIVPGKPEQSLLIKAVRRTDPDFKMPPKKELSAKEIALLEEWVRRGAPDPRAVPNHIEELTKNWWSLKPLVRPEVPAKGHPIDAFVRQRLDKEGLKPSPPADRRRLLRRLTIDLHGLPPTPDQVRAFVADSGPGAWKKRVDELLDSPRYGERWARHWLDTIHFADSHGCEHDVLRPNAWRFRDYVIDRLNVDVPWNRFIREQLAADVFFPNETKLVAGLGFIAAGPLELSRAGTAPVTFDYLDRDDMVTQTMAAFVSTTANCARCHTHKFDPVTQQDYYALQAVFAGVGKGDVEFDGDEDLGRKRISIAALKDAIEKGNADILLAPEHADTVADWIRRNEGVVAWTPLASETSVSAGGAELKRLDDGSVLAAGKRPDKDTYTVTGTVSTSRLSGIRVDVLAHDSLPHRGPGRQDNGNLHLNEFEARLLSSSGGASEKLNIRKATADWNQEGWTIAHALDGNEKTAWGIYPKVGASHQAVFEIEKPLELASTTRLQITLKQLHGGGHLIGRFRIMVTGAESAVAKVISEPVRLALQRPAAERSREQMVTIAAQALREYADEEWSKLSPRAMVYAVSPDWSHAKKLPKPMPPKTVHVLKRGAIDKPGKVAQPGALSALDFMPGRFDLKHPDQEATRRAALAEWIADPDNPLTWRSIVNRVWHYHFGRGLCDTPNDFGRMGGTPSHPELIDWLAAWFRDDAKGSLKELHRLILTSESYQQSSDYRGDPRALEIDVDNRLLWRMNRRRLDAESYRDSLLQITGRIDLKMGGPGIEQFTKTKGRQSTPVLNYAAYDWKRPGAGRRSIYRVVWRGIADPFMEALDFPDLSLLSPKRGSSISALQALTLYNNDFVLHHSEMFAARLEKEHANIEDQVRKAFLQVMLRELKESELGELKNYTQQHGLAALVRVLFNSNEFLYVD